MYTGCVQGFNMMGSTYLEDIEGVVLLPLLAHEAPRLELDDLGIPPQLLPDVRPERSLECLEGRLNMVYYNG